MTTYESTLSFMDRVPLSVRAGFALGVTAALGALDVAPAVASQESHPNTPVGIATYVDGLLAEGHFKEACAPDLSGNTCKIKHVPLIETKPVSSWTPLAAREYPKWLPYSQTAPNLPEHIRGAHMVGIKTPTFNKLGEICFMTKKVKGKWEVVDFDQLGIPKGTCDIPSS